MPKATVSHTRSWDYNNFSVSLTSDEELDREGVRQLQVEVMTLVDEMVERFKLNREVERDRERAERDARWEIEDERRVKIAQVLPPDPFQEEENPLTFRGMHVAKRGETNSGVQVVTLHSNPPEEEDDGPPTDDSNAEFQW